MVYIKQTFFTLLIFLCDRLVKFFLSNNLQVDLFFVKLQPPIYNNLLSLSLPLNNNISIIISFIGLILVFFLLNHSTISKNNFFYLAIIGAGLSNLFDRVVYGGVIDYLNIFNLSVVNLADVIIFISVLMVIYNTYKIDKT